MKKLNIVYIIPLMILMMSSCYEDKGNYSYDEIPVITAENMPTSITVVQKADPIVIEPSFTSSIEGKIDDNPNFEFGCKLYIKRGSLSTDSRYIDIDEEKNINVYYLPEVAPDDYVCWYTVTDKRTGVTTNFEIPVKVTSSTYEGWMVLSNVGAENKVRLDLVSVITQDRTTPIYDLLGPNAPDLRNGISLLYDAWPRYAKGDYIALVSETGTYALDATTLQTEEADNILMNDFIITPQDEKIVALNTVYCSELLTVTDKGNVYMRETYMSGSAFENPINTFVMDDDPAFTAAPFIGVHMERPSGVYMALLYDKDNKRFIKWDESNEDARACMLLADPVDAKFSFTTGKDMIAMVSTKFSGGTVYSVLEDESKARYVYGINLSGGAFSQSYYAKMDIENFDKATQFAFHSQYQYMFYDAVNKVYCYRMDTGTLSQPLTLSSDEEITLLKFNPYQRPQSELSDQSDEFWAQQYNLIVGSYKKNATDDNGGILRFYKFDQSNQTLTLVSEYTGFGKIRDVVYRER